MKALIISTDRFEDSELFYPKYRLKEEGVDVEVATPEGNDIEGKHDTEIESDLEISNINVDDYNLLVLPGGRSPEYLRVQAPEAADIVKEFDDKGKPISAICHGAQLLISADILEGRKLTCYWSLQVDVENAGGKFVDDEVVVDNNLVTSRHPDDLPAFMTETLKKL